MHIIFIANCLHVYSKCWNDRYIKSRDEYLHWWDCRVQTSARNICTGVLLLEEIEDLGLFPLQRLHALQVAGHEGTAVPSLSKASLLRLGEVLAVGCAGGGLNHGGVLLDFLGLQLVGHVELFLGFWVLALIWLEELAAWTLQSAALG